ncbi:MAG: SDR family NAD(P)-dependent oxidoreductase [Chloroflexaceae bacterium]|nr:SDR family NAD(P)-dependent oxidoreductase [Chloroflexaceae bacterium]
MQQRRITPESVFVVSGGARGITAQCVIAMAQRYQCRFLLLGRSARSVPETAWATDCTSETELRQRIIEHLGTRGEKPNPRHVQRIIRGIQSEREISATLAAIAEAGGQAEYLSLDITDRTAVQQQLPPVLQQMGQLTGLIHGAGSLADRLIENKTPADFEQVYAVKIEGLDNLLSCMPLDDLGYLVLFASVAGFYGNIGQSDYALANEIFNKVAHRLKRDYPHCHIVSINWGPWDGGMVTPAIKQMFADRDVEIIAPAAGTRMLLAELEAGAQAATQVVIGRPLVHIQPTLDDTLRRYRIERTLRAEDNPAVYDHSVGEHPVLPAVFGVSWMCNTCEQIYPGYKLAVMRGFQVLKGIVFDETLADVYTVDVEEVAKDAADGSITCDVRVWSSGPQDRLRSHYISTVLLRREPYPVPVYTDFDLSETFVVPGSEYYQNRTLFHGPTFQGIEKTLNISMERLTLLCRAPNLTPQQQGQFPIQTFNPYKTDVQFQGTLIWARHYYHFGSMPMGAALIEHFRAIAPDTPFYVSIEVQSHSASKLVARVISHDAEGRVYLRSPAPTSF